MLLSRHIFIDLIEFELKGECRIGNEEIVTFDGVAYRPEMRNCSRYLAVASTGNEDKLAVLIDAASKVRHSYLGPLISSTKLTRLGRTTDGRIDRFGGRGAR